MRSISGVSSGERLPTTFSANSSSKPSSSIPASAWRADSSPSSGGTRQSTCSSARPGITLIFCEAAAIVGATVTPSIGSIITASRGSRASSSRSARSGSAPSSPSARSSASDSGEGTNEGRARPSASITGASFTSALSPMRGIDAWPARPRAVTEKRNTPFSPVHTP